MSQESSRSEDLVTGLFLLLFLGAVGLAFMHQHRSGQRQTIDTVRESGEHLMFLLIAPTSPRDKSYMGAVRRAIDASREYAEREGYHFSTVGISDEWQPRDGLEILEEFGPFDELIVGRNGLNTGTRVYAHAIGEVPVFPQVIIAVQSARVDTLPYQFGSVRVLNRISGPRALEEWERSGYVLPSGAIAPPSEFVEGNAHTFN